MMRSTLLLAAAYLLLLSPLALVVAQPPPCGRNKVTAMPPPNPLPAHCNPSLPPVDLDTDYGTLVPINGPVTSILDTAQMRIFGGTWLVNAAVWSAAVKFNVYGKPTLAIPNFQRALPSNQTVRNRNIAMTYATYGVATFLSVPLTYFVKEQMATVGLDTNITCTPADETGSSNPACYGLLVSKVAIETAKKSGWNLDGSDGWEYNGAMFADYKAQDYNTVNTVDELKFPNNWQPLLETDRLGAFYVQRIITVYVATMKTLYLTKEQRKSFTVNWKPPSKAEYKQAVDDMLAASANLTDLNKLKAEIANWNTWVIDPIGQLAQEKRWDQMTFLKMNQATFAFHDAPIVYGATKLKYNTVRPQSAVRYQYGDKKVRAWGGPYKGTVNIAANEWVPYIRTGPDPEFVSGLVCTCQVFSDWLIKFLNTTDFSFTYKVKAGCSRIEPFATPAQDLQFTVNGPVELVKLCQDGRVYGGMHFPKSTEGSVKLCKGMGNIAYDYLKKNFWDQF